MDLRDRKRVFSNAFDPSNGPAPKVSRTMVGYSASSECSSSPPLPARSPLGSPFPSNFNVSSSGDDIFRCYSQAEPAICKERSDEGKAGPPVLGLQELSLHDGPKTLLPELHQSRMSAARTSVFLVESDSLQQLFPYIDSTDVVVCFNQGKQAVKTKSYLLCQASPFFATMLNGPYLDGHTRCIRLRNDFPHAITAMMQFLEHGVYVLTMALRILHTRLTMLDLHVHAYIVGAKYAVSNLCRHAIDEYIGMSRMFLSMALNRVNEQNMGDEALEMDYVLNSLVLIWRNTQHRDDALRQAVLELIKPNTNQLLRIPFFRTLLFKLAGFGDDLLHSLVEDGFDIRVRVFPAELGWLEDVGVRFGEFQVHGGLFDG